MKLNIKESNGGVETIRYGANDLKGLNKYRVDLYKPNSDWTALIKRTYVYAKDENDARTQLFNDIPNDVKKKYGFTDVEVTPIEVNKVKESLKKSPRRSFKEAVNGGWEVDERDVWDAYELASEYWGGEDAINKDIVRTLSDSELAEALAYIFRMNDFREWDEYINREDED